MKDESLSDIQADLTIINISEDDIEIEHSETK